MSVTATKEILHLSKICSRLRVPEIYMRKYIYFLAKSEILKLYLTFKNGIQFIVETKSEIVNGSGANPIILFTP